MADVQSEIAAESETLEQIQARHRKEQRDLISRTTQKKKQASKKTRKGVNDECERLERELKERQEAEIAALNGHAEEEAEDSQEEEDAENEEEGIAKLSLNGSTSDKKESSSSVNGDAAPAAKKKPNRAKARLARRAAEQSALVAEAEREAANAPNPRELEREQMAIQLQRHKLTLHEIRADGHCLYAAVADQLNSRELGLTPKVPISTTQEKNGGDNKSLLQYKRVRHTAADWIQSHANDFAGFMEDPLPEHVRKVRDTAEWGGHLELLALARAYKVRICVLHSDGQVDRIEPEGEARAGKEVEEIWLGYYKHSHGLGEHYNSLQKVP